MYDPVIRRHSLDVADEALRVRAAGDAAAPPELLAVAAFTSVLDEPARRDRLRSLRRERSWPRKGGVASPRSRVGTAGRGSRSRPGSRQTTLALLWAERYDQVRPLLDDSITQARLTGDSSRLAMGLANRAWLALRRGDLGAAEADARTAVAAVELPAPPAYRVLNGAVARRVLVEQGRLEAAEQALAPLDSEVEGGSLVAGSSPLLPRPVARGPGRAAAGLADFLAVGRS